jgi:hypothetical protein
MCTTVHTGRPANDRIPTYFANVIESRVMFTPDFYFGSLVPRFLESGTWFF